jgi:putative ABC transport system permease protein
MAGLLQDLRYGFRMLARNPGFTAVAIVALALGIGANTAIFSLVNSYLLKLLPYPDSDQLVLVNQRHKTQRIGMSTSLPNFLDWRAQNHVFAAMGATLNASFNLTGDGEPERVTGGRVSASVFKVLQLQPVLGRSFLEEEDRPGALRVAVLGQAFWQKRFGGRADIVGRQILINGERHTVVGVMPPGFRMSTMDYNIAVPLALDPARYTRGIQFLRVVARLKPGVTIERANAEMSTIAARLAREYTENRNFGVGISPLADWYVGRIRPSLLVLLTVVSVVLLIACVNVANLLLARATVRSRELSIRTALGAGRRRLVRQMMTESLLLCLCGGAAGVLAGYWGAKLMYSAIPVWMLPFRAEAMNANVLGFTLLATLATGALFGIAPALASAKADVGEALKKAGRGSSGGVRRALLRNALVVSELALAVMLLSGAALLVKSFFELQRVDLGFRPDHVLTADVMLSAKTYPKPADRAAFYEQLLARVSTQPGVVSAGAVSNLPFNGNISNYSFVVEGRPAPPPGEIPVAGYQTVSPAYFQTMGIPLLRGRAFTASDRERSTRVAIIDQTLASRYFPNEDPVGQRLKLGSANSPEPPALIVGVVGKVLSTSAEEKAAPTMYFPYLQEPTAPSTIVVRTAADPPGMLAGLKRAVRELNPNLPLANVSTMEEMVADSSAYRRLTMYVFAGFAALALVLAAVGLYGVISYSVAQRGHEIGIRMALGAGRRDVLRLVVGQGLALTATGTAAGLAGACALTRFLANMLFGVKPRDPLTFAAVALILALVATAAAYIPARRATRVDPLTALRYE